MAAKEYARVEPLGTSVAHYIIKQNIRYYNAATKPGMANAIMDMLRGAEVWARDHMLEMDEVVVEKSMWTADGRLIIEFARSKEVE